MAEYIERGKLTEALKTWQNKLIETYGASDEYVKCLESVFIGIDAIPAADVRPVVRGRWERHFERPGVYADLFWHCSACGSKNAESLANVHHYFCPNCGAEMREKS